MSIELSPEQHQALEQASEVPPRIVDPVTNTAYVLLRLEDFTELSALLDEEQAERKGWLAIARKARQRWMQESPYGT